MKQLLLPFFAASFSLSAQTTTIKSEPVQDRDTEYFNAVTSKLDKGGTSYIYFTPANAYVMIQEIFDGSRAIIEKKISDAEQRKNISSIFDMVDNMVASSGVTDIKGCGFSAKAADNGFYRGKGVIYAPEKKGVIWKIIGETHKFSILKKLPANTSFTYYSQSKLDILWSWIKTQIKNNTPENMQSIDELEHNLLINGIDLNKLLKSTTGEYGVILTIDPKQKEAVDFGNLPEFSVSHFEFAIFIGVNNSDIFDQIKSRMRPPSQTVDDASPENEIQIKLPQNFPEFIKPVIAMNDGLLIVSSNPSLIKKINDPASPKLVNTPAFKRIAGSIKHDEGLSFKYADRNSTEFVIQLQQALSQSNPVQEIISQIQNLNKPLELFAVTSNYDKGIEMEFNSNIDPTANTLAKAAMLPAALIAAAIFPAIEKGREKAEQIKALSDLKQIGLALKMFAMNNDNKFPAKSGASSLNILVDKNYLSDDVLKNTKNTFWYIGGMNETMDINLPLVIVKPHSGDKNISVLMLGGHAISLPSEGNTDCVEIVKMLNKNHAYSPKDYKLLLKEARKLDSGMIK